MLFQIWQQNKTFVASTYTSEFNPHGVIVVQVSFQIRRELGGIDHFVEGLQTAKIRLKKEREKMFK